MIDLNEWLKEAKNDMNSSKVGMYLFHNGVVRKTAKDYVRNNLPYKEVTALSISYDKNLLDQEIANTKNLDGIYYVKVHINEGTLKVGDDIMFVLIGGDIRPNVTKALDYLVGKIKSTCITEKEIY